MEKQLKSSSKGNKPWNRLNKERKEIALYVKNAVRPISIDDLISLSNRSAVSLLNIIDELKRDKILKETREYGKGIYFLDELFTEQEPDDAVFKNANQKALEKLLRYYKRSLKDTSEKDGILADLYVKLNRRVEGARYIIKTADLLSVSNQNEKAAEYYGQLRYEIEEAGVTETNVDIYLNSAIGRIATSSHILSLKEQVSILTRADEIAIRFHRWDCLSKVKLILGQKLQAAGERDKAYKCIADFQSLAEETGNPRMLKTSTLLLSEFLHWKGTFGEVVRQYERFVEEEVESVDDTDDLLKATARIGLCYVRTGQIKKGMDLIISVKEKAKRLKTEKVAQFSEFMLLLALFETRSLAEGETIIRRFLAMPQEELGHFILSPANSCLAYILCKQKRHEEAYEYLRRAVNHVRAVGWSHQNGAWNFETMRELEINGFVHPTWNYDAEIDRLMEWDDNYMKGVAHRYRALKYQKLGKPLKEVIHHLRASETLLDECNAKIELARTWVAYGSIFNEVSDHPRSRNYFKKAWDSLKYVDKERFPRDLLYILPIEQREDHTIQRLAEANETLVAHKMLPIYLETTLGIAMNFMAATRGAIIEKKANGELAVICGRNLDPFHLQLVRSHFAYSLFDEVIQSGKELIYPGPTKPDKNQQELIHTAKIISAIGFPIKSGDKIFGLLYMDNRFGNRSFDTDRFPLLRLICSQTAVGIAGVRSFNENRESRRQSKNSPSQYVKPLGFDAQREMVIGTSTGMRQVMDQVHQVSNTDLPVLILGETGVGKELVAKAIHRLSGRKAGPYVTINLAAIPSELVASELFGHEKGAFTGATAAKKGRFELADNGTILLDEIGDLPIEIQIKILRVLQENEFERLGSANRIHSDFRLISATNRDLFSEVNRGNFRQDLFFRLNVFPILIPPLRERKQDIPSLAQHFIEVSSQRTGKPVKPIGRGEQEKLMEYDWPGNIRELKHVIQRSVLTSAGDSITFSEIRPVSLNPIVNDDCGFKTLDDMDKAYIQKVLESVFWKISGPNGAADILGLNPSTLRFRMKKLAISKPTESLN